MRHSKTSLPSGVWLACGVLSLGACAHGDDLGRRARDAARQGNIAAFDGLMAEATERTGRSRLEVPERTVFTHFLALAAHPEFDRRLEAWAARGLVPPGQTCSIERARHRALRTVRPDRALAAAWRAVDLARSGALEPARSWLLEACLHGASFLSETSTAALRPFLRLVADPSEPPAFRQALLHGMTHRFLQDPARRLEQVPPPSPPAARAAAERQLEAESRRFSVIVEAAELAQDLPTLAAGTSFLALELERAAGALGRSFLPSFAGPNASADRRDLADAWIAQLRAGRKVPRLEPLGLWRSDIEPRGPHLWYACLDRPRPGQALAFTSTAALGEEQAARRCPAETLPAPGLVGPFRLRYTLERFVGPRAIVAEAGRPGGSTLRNR